MQHFKGPWTPKLTYIFYPFSWSAEYSDNFDSNIGAQRFVKTEKFTFEVDDLRKRAAMMAHDDVMSLAYRRHEY